MTTQNNIDTISDDGYLQTVPIKSVAQAPTLFLLQPKSFIFVKCKKKFKHFEERKIK